MIAVAYKNKQYLFASTKVLLLVISFEYIIYKFKINSPQKFNEFMASILTKRIISRYEVLLFLVLTSANGLSIPFKIQLATQ